MQNSQKMPTGISLMAEEVKNKKNIEALQQIFLVSLSLDPKGPSGNKGGGSTFFAKVGQ